MSKKSEWKEVITICDNPQFEDVYEAINYLLQKDQQEKEQKERQRIGFKTSHD